MVDIVMLMGWSYISIIYEESNYGIKVTIVYKKICSFEGRTFIALGEPRLDVNVFDAINWAQSERNNLFDCNTILP